MNYNTPPEMTAAAVQSGVTKASLPVRSVLIGGFLAGAYIAFASLLAVVATAGMPPEIWGGMISVVTGLVFSLGLVLVIIGGAELLTGNMMLLPMAAFARRITPSKIAINWTLVLIANLVGSLFVAYFLAYKSGVVGTAHSTGSALDAFTRLSKIATGKAVTETHLEVFLRAIGCNWLVALGVWLALAAKDIAGKILGIIFPIMAFVAMGFDHVVANMFFLPLALMAHVPHVTFGDVVWNLVLAFLGNLVGALVFVACAYWGMYGRTVMTQTADVG